jgi:hypothetical protein
MKGFTTLFLLFLIIAGVLQGESQSDQSLDELLISAETSFKSALAGEGSYQEAVQLYCQAADRMTRPSASLYYNLGNILQLDGESSAALMAYSKALSLSPTAPDILSNRNHLLEELKLPQAYFNLPETFIWGVLFLTGIHWGWVIFIILTLFSCSLSLLSLLNKKYSFKILILIVSLMAVFMVLSLGSWENRTDSLAVVSLENSVLRGGDSQMYEVLVELPAGTELIILETRLNWSRVRVTSSEHTGWIEGNHIMNAEDLIERYK